MSEVAIEARSLRKEFPGQVALRGLTLSVRRGESFGLIGLNGAGKTTFIKLMLGIARPSGGEVRVLGGDPEEPAVRARIGYLPERLALPASYTPPMFLGSVARLKGLGGAKAEIERQIERVGLKGARGQKIGGFSKGMKQRLGLAAALLGSPDLLVLDEPTDGVDPLGRVEIREILREENARGATVFLNSHLLAETERVCRRVGILVGGELAREGALGELGQGQGWRVRFAGGAGAERLAALGFVAQEGEGNFRIDAPSPEELNERLDQARAAGALLVGLEQEGADLEGALAQAVGQA
jgi:ABC-2 type transport system ATP-binding protein